MANIERGGLAFPCRMPVYTGMWLYMVWLCRHHDRFAASTVHIYKLIAWAQFVAESKFPPFVACCPFPVLQICVVSCTGSPVICENNGDGMVPHSWTLVTARHKQDVRGHRCTREEWSCIPMPDTGAQICGYMVWLYPGSTTRSGLIFASP